MERALRFTTAAHLVAPLRSFTEADVAVAGGKGANLGELLRAGFPVPPGFVVTTAAYERFVRDNRLGETMAAALRRGDGAGATIRAAMEAAPLPPGVEAAIRAGYAQLGPEPVAVRSSATAEDLPEAAFAGQQDSYLNVIGAEALLATVRRCWASLWSDRAIAYRARLGLEQEAVKMAVVVQRMVAAEAAGVLFTANTVTGARDEMLIDANPGLGEAIVGGLVTPDHFRLRKERRRWRIVEERLGRREVIVRAAAGGGTEHVEGAGRAEEPAVPARSLQELARLGEAIQAHFGVPQDVEWAWAGGTMFIVQARPITALPGAPPRANRLQRLLASNFVEMLPVRPYPLDMDTWIPALGGAVEPLFTVLGLAWHLTRLFEEADGVVVRLTGKLPRPTWRVLLAPLRLVGLMARYKATNWQADPLLAEMKARARALAVREGDALSWNELLATVAAAKEISVLAGEVRRRYFPSAVFAAARLRLLLMLLGHREQWATLMAGSENETLALNRALAALAAQVRADAALAQLFATYQPEELAAALAQEPAAETFLAAFHAFLQRYGHRETVISTALAPTWQDAPEVALGVIQSFASHEALREGGKPAAQAALEKVMRHPLLRFGPLRAAFLKTLAEAQSLMQMREDTHFYATLPLPVFRRTLLECGRRLLQAGVLNEAEDVFHLRLAEVARAGKRWPPSPAMAADLQAAAARRKAERARLAGTPLVDPRILPQHEAAAGALLGGMAGSPGVAEGPARIVGDSSEFNKLAAGDVLVAPFTNPSWTPLFQRAAAVVVDSGSVASHAAIVAREYGIPAVMGTISGTQMLRDGQMVRVDGNRGLVFAVAVEGSG